MTIRILHALGIFDHGGVEAWLVDVLRRTDRREFQMDFLVHLERPGVYDREIRELGSRIITCRPTGLRRPYSYLTYPGHLLGLLKEHGPYDVVHGHLQEFSGYLLRAAAKAGVRARVAHSHTCVPPTKWQPGIAHRMFYRWLRSLIDRHATLGLACSRVAAQSLFGDRWESDDRWKLLYCGIDPSPFAGPPDVESTRAGLGIPPTAPVVGHVGRFVAAKNHAFLVDLIAECVRQRPEVRFLLVGEGPLRPTIQRMVADRGLSQNVVFTGARSDVPRLMLSAMDMFVFPSLWEGLGIVLLEAQAAGLPILVADCVPDEFNIGLAQIERLRLTDGPGCWGRQILQMLDRKPDRRAALNALSQSPYTIENSAETLHELYRRAVTTPDAAYELVT
jgi:glycosyltransferase involved in cell wall biosynthesis